MDCLLEILAKRPLSVRFSLFNPPDGPAGQRVPRPLMPVGLFVTLEVSDAAGRRLYLSERPKQKLKLHPGRSESYLTLEPGYSYGAVLTVDRDELNLQPGHYRLSAVYSNGIFSGPEEAPIGPLACAAEQAFTVT